MKINGKVLLFFITLVTCINSWWCSAIFGFEMEAGVPTVQMMLAIVSSMGLAAYLIATLIESWEK